MHSPPHFVLDSWAVLAWLRGEEPAANRCQRLFTAASRARHQVSMSLINLGEVYYIVARRDGPPAADETCRRFQAGPVRILPVSDEVVWRAVRLKATHPLSYADAIAAAQALVLGATLVTGDREFAPLQDADGLKMLWLDRHE